jgi:hypothetical protein
LKRIDAVTLMDTQMAPPFEVMYFWFVKAP